MKKLYLLAFICIFYSVKSQFSEVLDFTDANKLVDNSSYYEDHIFQNKFFYITKNESTKKTYLYSFDPATDSVTQLADVSFPNNSTHVSAAAPASFVSTANYIYFTTTSAVNLSGMKECGLWRSDGTTAGTIKLLDFQSGLGSIQINSVSMKFVKSDFTLGNDLIFIVDNPNGKEIWKTDGTVAGTVLVKNVGPGGYIGVFLVGKTGNNILFTGGLSGGINKTDGTTAGTVNVLDGSGNIQTLSGYLGIMNGRFFYYKLASASPESYSVHSTDGNTVQNHPSLPGYLNSATMNFRMDGNNGMYYIDTSYNPTTKHNLFFTDQNTANAYKMADLPAGNKYEFLWANQSGVLLSKYLNNNVTGQVFVSKQGQIYNFDNSLKNEGGTKNIIEYKNTVYTGGKLVTDTPYYGTELWRMDTQNCALAKDFYTGTTVFNGTTIAYSSNPSVFFVLNDQLYFTALISGVTKLIRFNGDFTFNNSQNNNSWNNSLNWTAGMTPMMTDNAIIPSGFAPVIEGSAFANNMNVTSPINLTSGSLNIGGNLNLGAKITLNNNSLNLKGGNSQINNGNSTNYIITNGTGTVNVENLNAAKGTVNLPIGTSTNYNPVSISNSGTSDTFSVKVSDGIANTTNGAVNATWEISEGTAGGSNVSLTLGWNASQQNAAFDSASAKVGHYLNGNWTAENSGAVSNNSITATGISSFSPFAVMNFGALAASDFSKSKVLIYPNPFNENLNISTENGGVVHFYDLSGKLVSTSVLMKGTNSLNKSSLAKGVYIYQIKNTNDEILSSGKVIKN